MTESTESNPVKVQCDGFIVDMKLMEDDLEYEFVYD